MDLFLRFIKVSFLAITAIICFQMPIYGQSSYGMEVSPRLSPDKHLYHRIGYTSIEIKYSSPAVKERKIWNELVSYDKVWRAGANNATTIEFGEDVIINGHELAAGKYGFFIIPKEKKRWVIIFNKVYEQWGAFNYSASEDALRVESLPIQTSFTENLIYSVESKGPEYGTVFLNWGRYKIGFEVKTNHLQFIEKEMAKSYEKADDMLKWVCYLEGADYLLKENTHLELALKWINQSEREVLSLTEDWNKKYTPKEFIMGNMYWIKARLLAQKKDYKAALENADKMKTLKGEFLFYPTFKKKMKIDDTIAGWEKNKN